MPSKRETRHQPDMSATPPTSISTNVLPIISVTILLRISLLLSGMVSTLMEKINGKIFAKPSPITKIMAKTSHNRV